MSALRIVKDGAPVLKKTAAPVKTITKRVKRLLDDMAETMYSAEYGPEGCLSVPGIYGDVSRYTKIKVQAKNRFGKTVIYEPEGFLARIFQHEMDHLKGHLFTEKAVNLRKVDES